MEKSWNFVLYFPWEPCILNIFLVQASSKTVKIKLAKINCSTNLCGDKIAKFNSCKPYNIDMDKILLNHDLFVGTN